MLVELSNAIHFMSCGFQKVQVIACFLGLLMSHFLLQKGLKAIVWCLDFLFLGCFQTGSHLAQLNPKLAV